MILPALLFTIAATHSTFHLAGSSPSFQATGTGSVSKIDIKNGAGTIVLDQVPMATFIQQKIPWADQGVTLYQGLAFDAKHWDIYWIYCDGSNPHTQMADFFYESMNGNQTEEAAVSGTCDDLNQDTQIPIDLPAINLDQPTPVQDFTISGNAIQLKPNQIGTIQNPTSHEQNDQKFSFIPFLVVDCRGCGQGGWYELHSLFWNDISGRACFGIVYLLLPEEKGHIVIEHSFCLPDTTQPLDDLKFQATWSRSSSP